MPAIENTVWTFNMIAETKAELWFSNKDFIVLHSNFFPLPVTLSGYRNVLKTQQKINQFVLNSNITGKASNIDMVRIWSKH